MTKERQQGIQINLFNYFSEAENFTLSEAKDAVLNHYNQDVKEPSIRARIYEGIDKGLFQRVSKGVYTVTKKDAQGKENTCLLINGDGRDLSMIADNSIDTLITDHPYKLDKALKGGNRDFASYDLFQYEQKDFDEKCRVLKPGAFLLEFLPEESEVNYEYLYQVKQMAKNSGFQYFSKVSWKKGNFVANTGRKAKNKEDIMFFSKGEPRALKLDTKKNKATAIENGLDVKGLDSYQLRDLLEEHDLPVALMKGTAGMLPTEFDFQPRGKAEKVMEAEKPVELFEAILPFVSLPGERVLDQFAGSGNLGIAAINSGRDVILIEKDKETFEKMKQNIERALGEKAVLETEIEDICETISEIDDVLETEYREHGDSVYASQLEGEVDRLEDEIINKDNAIKALDTEIDCYREVISIGFHEQQKEVHSTLDEKLQNYKKEQVIVNQTKTSEIDVLKINPWSAGNDKRIYVKANIEGRIQTVFYDVNKNEWFNQRKEKANINREFLETQVKNCVGAKDMMQFVLLNKNYVKQNKEKER